MWFNTSNKDPQSNTNSDVHHVDNDQVRTINFTDDGHAGVDRGQDTSFVEDALPSAEMNDAEEPTPVSDNSTAVEADGQGTEEYTPDVPTTPRLLPTPPPPPRQRHRRILPTSPWQQPDSPVTRTQRNRGPPQYLSDHVTFKQTTTQPEWMMKVNWLKHEAKNGRFKGLEMELARTIMDIIKGTT